MGIEKIEYKKILCFASYKKIAHVQQRGSQFNIERTEDHDFQYG